VAPTFDEMSAATGIARSHLHFKLKCLEERGLIRRMRHRARAIEIVPTDPYSAEALAALPEADLLALQHRLNTALLNATSRRAA
jgi:SOS-response transcriptional repressor LexA